MPEYDPDVEDGLPRHAQMVHWLLGQYPGATSIRLTGRQLAQLRQAMAPYFECEEGDIVGMRSGPLPRRDGRWPHGGRWKVWFHKQPLLEVDANEPPPATRRP